MRKKASTRLRELIPCGQRDSRNLAHLVHICTLSSNSFCFQQLHLPRVVEVVELRGVDEGQVEPRVVVLHQEVEPDEPDPRDGDRRARQDESRRGWKLQR